MKAKIIYAVAFWTMALFLSIPSVPAQDLHPQGILTNGVYYTPNGAIIVSGVSCSVEPLRDVTFAATGEIILDESFHVKPGAEFEAKVVTNTDTDQDGMADWWELEYGLDPTNTGDAAADKDGDGLTNLQEFQNRTDPSVYQAPVITFSVDPQAIQVGASATLHWNVNFAASITIQPGLGEVAASGSQTINPALNTVYTLTATGPGGTRTAQVAVGVKSDMPVISFQAAPKNIWAGETTKLSWKVIDAVSVSIDRNIGSVLAEDKKYLSPTETTTYTLTATGTGGVATKTVTVAVYYPAPRVLSLKADPLTIPMGQSSTLTWTSTENALSASMDQGIGDVPVNGSVSVTPNGTKIYTLTVSGKGGTASAGVTVGDFTDADNDTLPDAWEINYFGAIDKFGPEDDPDGDLLTNLMEYNKGTHPRQYNAEDVYLEGPLQNGTYASGGKIIARGNCSVAAGQTVVLKANCSIKLQPGLQVVPGARLIVKPGDCDRLPDEWEMVKFGSLQYSDTDDPDKDGLTNYDEYVLGTDPTFASDDQDNDGLKDWWELKYFGDLSQGYYGDYDHDGIANFIEFLAGTNPNNPGSRPKPGNYYEYDILGRIKKVIKIK